MAPQDFSNLTGKFLIASPYTMEGNVFHQSLIYVVHHSENGSVGFIVNRLINNSNVNSVLKQTNPGIDLNFLKNEIHIGGPVDLERGFFLHSADYNKNLLYLMEDSFLAVSSNLEILEDINQGKGPKYKLFLIGYTGWGPGEMESEIKNNLWIVSEPHAGIIFTKRNALKWQLALSELGIDSADFAPSSIANC